MHLKDVVTILIAVYAAGLSTVVYVDQRKAAEPQIVVSTDYDWGKDRDGKDIALFGVRVVNNGDDPVWLDGVGYGWSAPMELPSNFRFSEPLYGWSSINPVEGPTFPTELKPGRATVTWYDLQKTIDYMEGISHENTEKIHLRYTDETGREYRSKPEDWQEVLHHNHIMQIMLAADLGIEYQGHGWAIDRIPADEWITPAAGD